MICVHCIAGPHYLRMNTGDRKGALRSQYHFECQCKACISSPACDQVCVLRVNNRTKITRLVHTELLAL